MKIIYKTILSLIIWNGKMSQFAEYLRSLTMNIKNKTKQFFASPEKLKRIDFRNFSVRTTTLLCHTAPHHETRGQREVHITVSHSTTSYDLRQREVKQTNQPKTPHITMSHRAKTSKNKRHGLASFRCAALFSSF